MPKKKKITLQKLKLADNREVLSSLRRIKIFIKKGEWLSQNNRYRKNTTNKIRIDTKNRTNKIRHNHMRDYIAISSVLHCFDGWIFLGKALNSILNLDFNIAKHLIYYAELRAGISILSSQGIGIFNRTHIILQSGKQSDYIDKIPTHDMTWKALEYWNSLRKSSYELLNIIRPGNKSLNEWLLTFGIDKYREQVGNKWLQAWGLDLKNFPYDRKARNYLVIALHY